MGLDMYADSIAPSVSYVKALLTKSRVAPPKQIHQWRKHPDLHAWMEQLWRCKTRSNGSAEFNQVRVRLSQKDLDDLEHDICEQLLPKGEGFFFGESDGSECADDLAFVEKARKELARGRRVYYTSSW